MAGRTEPRDDKMLTKREAEFVGACLVEDDVPKAAKSIGLTPQQGRAIMARPHVRAEVKKRMERIMAKKEITAERVVEEISKVGFANLDDFVDEDYALKRRPSREAMAAVQSVKSDYDDDGNPVRSEVKMHSKLTALDMLAKKFNIYATDKKVNVSVEIGDQLARALERRDGMDD